MNTSLAEDLLRALLSVDPKQPEWNYLLAFCLHMQAKDLNAAIKHYDLAAELGFAEFWVRYQRGGLYLQMGNMRNAWADLERAVQLKPENNAAREMLEQLKKEVSSGQAE